MDLSREDIRRQLDLEAESRSLGEARYDRSRPMPWRTETGSVEEEANLPPGQHLLRLAVEPTAAAIREFVEKANEGKAGRRHSAVKWLELASPEEVAYLTARAPSTSARPALAPDDGHQRSPLGSSTTSTWSRSRARTPGYYGLIKKSRWAKSRHRARRKAVRKMLESEEPARPSRRARSSTSAWPPRAPHRSHRALRDRHQRTANGPGYYVRPTEAVEKWLTEQHARSAACSSRS
jgi:DNA-directed RNA polymerase